MQSKRDQLKSAQTRLVTRPTGAEQTPGHLEDEYTDGFFVRIALDAIMPDPNQPRKTFDQEAMKELSQSIKAKGVLQPVIIRQDGKMFYLVAGERRYRAAKMAGLKEIPAIFTNGNPAEIALIENLQREDLNPIEEAQAYERMIKEYKYTQDKLAAAIGKARATITHTLSLNQLPEVIKEECARAHIPKRTLIEIARQDSPEKMLALYKRVKEFNLTSDEVRSIASKKKGKPEVSPGVLVLRKVKGLTNSLGTLDLSELEDDERMSLFQEIGRLQKALADLINI
jgi:ParB family chromosome partitioning protein